MKSKIIALILALAVFVVPCTAFADTVYLDPETYNFPAELSQRAQTTTGGETYQGYIVTADDEDTLYYIGCKNASSFLNTTSSTGMFNGHSYILYTATSDYASFSVQSATSSQSVYSGISWYKYIFFGDDYIRQNIGALADKVGASSSYTYGGSCMIVNAGLNGSNSLQNFFPKTPVTTLTKALKGTAVTGALTEIVNLLPLLIPCLIAWIALRKGYSFLKTNLQTA